MAYIHLYTGTPTSGGTDGTVLSEGTASAPLTISLNATNNEESASVKMAIRCDSGYQTNGNVTITPTGTTASMWALAPDNAGVAGAYGAYGSALTLTGITATNKLFWVKAKSTSAETPVNDVTVDLVISATIEVP